MRELTAETELAHEIKNPLAMLKMNVDILNSTVENEENRKILLTMVNEINKIDKVVKSFLNFTMEKDLEKDNVYIKDIIENIINDNYLTFPKTVINLIWEDDDICIVGHEYHMNMIFNNLIKNSIEAMSGVGVINIKMTQQDGIGIVTIEDNGKGIHIEDKKNILQDFYTTKDNGSGIGLTIVNNIVKIYNGDFYIDNNDKEGVTATVKLPLE